LGLAHVGTTETTKGTGNDQTYWQNTETV
jgi:hypothetical protein